MRRAHRRRAVADHRGVSRQLGGTVGSREELSYVRVLELRLDPSRSAGKPEPARRKLTPEDLEALTRSYKPLPPDHPLRSKIFFVPVPKRSEPKSTSPATKEATPVEQSPDGQPLRYVVLVDDNFHYHDEDERFEAGRFPTLEEAITECARRVMESLDELYEPGMTAEELYDHYTSFGEDPFVVNTSTSVAQRDLVPFSAWDFAREQAPHVVQAREKKL